MRWSGIGGYQSCAGVSEENPRPVMIHGDSTIRAQQLSRWRGGGGERIVRSEARNVRAAAIEAGRACKEADEPRGQKGMTHIA